MEEPPAADAVAPPPARFYWPGSLRGLFRGFAWEPTLINLIALVVGVYAGVATGLLSGFISLFQLLFFRPGELFAALSGRDPTWYPIFLHKLAIAHWHFELLAIGLVAIVAARLLSPVSTWKPLRAIPIFEKRRLRVVVYLLGFGLVLYYPLLALASFTRSFGAAGGGLLAIAEGAPRILWFLVPLLGGLIVGPLVRYVFPESGGHGVAEVVEAVAVGRTDIPGRVALWKSMVAGLTIGSGGSCGREGPVVHMGAAVGSELSRRLGLSRNDAALVLAAGGAAGLAASFAAPIAGAMFGLEIILGDFAVSSVAPIVLAAVTATVTARALAGAAGEMARVSYALVAPGEIAAYAGLGVLCGLGGVAYAAALHESELFFSGERNDAVGRFIRGTPVWLRPALGGLGVGVLGFFAPRVLGNGYETMNAAIVGELSLGVLVVVFVAKLLATSCTLGSGAPGGSFFPAVFLGAMLGGAFGTVVHALVPSYTATSGAYAAVGMGAFVAGATLAPLTGMLMIVELTGSYQVVPPLMIACGLSALLVQLVLGGSIYTRGLKARGVLRGALWPSHMRRLSVSDAMVHRPEVVAAGATLGDLRATLAASAQLVYPVLDPRGRLAGLLDVASLRTALYRQEGIDELVVAAELCDPHPETIRETDDLLLAADRLATGRALGLPVVAAEDPGRLVGLVTRREVLQALNRALVAKRELA